MYVCRYACIYACMYACRYVGMYVCMYVCVYVCMYVCMYTVYIYACACISIYVHICIYMHRYVNIYIYRYSHICVSTCMYTPTYVCIYIQTERCVYIYIDIHCIYIYIRIPLYIKHDLFPSLGHGALGVSAEVGKMSLNLSKYKVKRQKDLRTTRRPRFIKNEKFENITFRKIRKSAFSKKTKSFKSTNPLEMIKSKKTLTNSPKYKKRTPAAPEGRERASPDKSGKIRN